MRAERFWLHLSQLKKCSAVCSACSPHPHAHAPLLAAFLHWLLPPSLGLLFCQSVIDLHSPAHSTLWFHSPFLSLSASALCLLFHFFLALTYLFWLWLTYSGSFWLLPWPHFCLCLVPSLIVGGALAEVLSQGSSASLPVWTQMLKDSHQQKAVSLW